jgi:hypothetical protein
VETARRRLPYHHPRSKNKQLQKIIQTNIQLLYTLEATTTALPTEVEIRRPATLTTRHPTIHTIRIHTIRIHLE